MTLIIFCTKSLQWTKAGFITLILKQNNPVWSGGTVIRRPQKISSPVIGREGDAFSFLAFKIKKKKDTRLLEPIMHLF
jgi:hypothetical protein